MIYIYIITDQLNIGSVKHWDYEDDKYSFLPVLFPFLLSANSNGVSRSFVRKTLCNYIPRIIFKYPLARFEWIASH